MQLRGRIVLAVAVGLAVKDQCSDLAAMRTGREFQSLVNPLEFHIVAVEDSDSVLY